MKATSGGRAVASMAPGARVRARRARSRASSSPASMRSASAAGPPRADPGALGVLGARGQLAVEEHRQLRRLADQRGGGERLGAGRRRARPRRRQTTGITSSAPTCGWMPSCSLRSISRDRRLRRRLDQARGQLALPRREREHAAVVVGVAVDVEDPRRPDRPLEALELGQVAPLAEVGHGHQQRPAVLLDPTRPHPRACRSRGRARSGRRSRGSPRRTRAPPRARCSRPWPAWCPRRPPSRDAPRSRGPRT